MQWTPDVNAKLFVHVLNIHDIKLDYQALAAAMGNDCTAKAVTHQIAKLRSMAENVPSTNSTPGTAAATTTDTAAGPTTPTPVKRARVRKVGNATSRGGKATGGRKRKAQDSPANDEDGDMGGDEGEFEEKSAPTAKKPRTKATPRSRAPKVQVLEEADEEENQLEDLVEEVMEGEAI